MTAVAKQTPPAAGDLVPWTERDNVFIPFGESESIKLSVGMVRQFLAIPTKSGKFPSDADCLKFVMLCRARQLNPWVKDCWLVGYDSKDGPTFEQITAHQALLKRAEANPAYRGVESGVIVKRGDEIIEIEGAFAIDGDILIGGWARVWRSDRDLPQVGKVKLATYDTKMSRWAKDPHGMIQKVAEAAALRKAFPTQLGGLYCAEEMGEVGGARPAAPPSSPAKVRRSDLEDRLAVTHQKAAAEPASATELLYEPDPEYQQYQSSEPTIEELAARGEYERVETDSRSSAPAVQASMLDDEEGDTYYGSGG
jgi:phage recombination protein Bet